MTATLNMKVHKLLVKHEGSKLFPYTDTVGKLTIGVGRNLTDRGLSQAEVDFLLENDIAFFVNFLNSTFPWFKDIGEIRQSALVDMCFNLGPKGFCDFKNMIECLSHNDFLGASTEMLLSKWAKQVGQRAIDLASIIRLGVGS